ncbi:hypothetical protein ACHAPV_003851 [Trichoderma viride]
MSPLWMSFRVAVWSITASICAAKVVPALPPLWDLDARSINISRPNSSSVASNDSSVQLFSASQVASLSSGCSSAMTKPLSCSSLLISPLALYTLNTLTEANLTALCVTKCTNSIASYRENVLSACAKDVTCSTPSNGSVPIPGTGLYNDIYNIQGGSIRPVHLADYFLLNYKINCLQDNSDSAKWCYLKAGEENLVLTNSSCDACSLGAVRARIEGFDEYSSEEASAWSSHITTACKTTAAPLSTPKYSVILADNKMASTIVSGYNPTPTPCSGKLVPVARNASCDDFAKSHVIGTEQLLAINHLQSGCVGFPGNKTSLCIQGSCQTYAVAANDTCGSIAAHFGLWPLQVRLWNPMLDPQCRDLARMVGRILCVSNPSNYTTPSVSLPPATTVSSPVFSSPSGSSVAYFDLPTVTTTWTMPPLPTGKTTKYPLANGSVAGCFKMWDNPYSGMMCNAAAAVYNADVDSWIEWNPSVLNGGNYSVWDCVLQQNTSYCGLLYDPANSATTNSTDADSAFVPPPEGSTPGATTQCLVWYTTVDGPQCRSMWSHAAYCVLSPSNATSTLKSAPSTSKTAKTTTTKVTPPGTTQLGVAKDCNKYALAKSGQTCDGFATANGITTANLYAWNTVLNEACTHFQLGAAYCIEVSK